MRTLLPLVLTLAACGGPADPDDDTDVVDTDDTDDTDTDAGDDTDVADDTDADDSDGATDSDVVDPNPDSPCALPAVDRYVDLGGTPGDWTVVTDAPVRQDLRRTAAITVSDLVPGETVGFRVSLPGDLTIDVESDLYLFAEVSGRSAEGSASAVAGSPVSDMTGVTVAGGGNNSWWISTPDADEAYFYGTFVFAEGVPASTAVSCFAWTYTVPTTAPAFAGGTLTLASPFSVTIDRLDVRVAATDSSHDGPVLTWSTGGAL